MILDLIGERFGRLLVTSKDRVDTRPNGHRVTFWKCKCDCGNELAVCTGSLRSGNTQSCGCLQKERASLANRVYREPVYKTRLYRIWIGMKNRCYNKHHASYQNYGGRGITICQEWLDLDAFCEWALNNGYSDDLTIHRIDNDMGYFPDNCVWATYETQNNACSRNIFIEYNDEVHTLKEWSDILSIPYKTLYCRVQRGWSVERAFTEEVKR